MIQKYVIILISWSIVLLVPAYKWHKGAIDSLKNQHTQELALLNQQSRNQEHAYQDKMDKALKEAKQREHQNRIAASNALNELNRLRKYSDKTADSLSKTTRETCNQYGVLATKLLSECSGKYQELAETTDRCSADLRLMYEGWPDTQTSP